MEKLNPRMVAAKCQECGLVDTFYYSYSSGLRSERRALNNRLGDEGFAVTNISLLEYMANTHAHSSMFS